MIKRGLTCFRQVRRRRFATKFWYKQGGWYLQDSAKPKLEMPVAIRRVTFTHHPTRSKPYAIDVALKDIGPIYIPVEPPIKLKYDTFERAMGPLVHLCIRVEDDD